MRRAIFNIILGTVLLGAAAQAEAQQPQPALPAPPAQPAQPAQPALIVEQIQNGWLFSPDVRATDLDGRAEALAGGYLGRITDRTWVIGVGGYMLTNPADDRKLWYGGPVFEWLIRADRRIGFGVRTLVGAGSGTLSRPLSEFITTRGPANIRNDHRGGDPRGGFHPVNSASRVAVQDDFYVAEPQLNVMWNLTAGQRIVFGVGYRAVGNAPYLGDDLSGLSGSLSFQLGGK